MLPDRTDVFICGAGPVGLVIAYQLNRFGISTCIIDSANKASPEMPMYGRASSLHPRTLELLDQLDLADDLMQDGFYSNRSFTYKNGERVAGRGWSAFSQLVDTQFTSALNLRLKFIEDMFREKLAEQGTGVHAPNKLVDFAVNEKGIDDYKVTISCKDSKGSLSTVRAKYIIGTDGGSSTVRKIGQIPFPGDNTEQFWVRIDAHVKTNIPDERIGFGTIESDTHGQVLWAALDHGATRIGYVLSKSLGEKYGRHMTEEEAMYEAKQAVAPFELEFLHVDWHTVYGIQQHVAQRLVDRDCVILAGDAAHTHSSATAQGMNTGVHDATNLAWKLAGVMKGWFRPEVLQLYSDERRAIALQLIENDKTISSLVAGSKPAHMADRPETPMVLLSEFMKKTSNFGIGLGIFYAPNLLNDVSNAFAPVLVQPGYRAPDVLIHKPGFRQIQTRLYDYLKNHGKFHVVVFTGKVERTRSQLQSLRAQIDQHCRPFAHAVDYLTIIERYDHAFDEHLGVRKFGKACWDIDSSAHWRFGIGGHLGALIVLRPDTIVGTSAPLDGFSDFVVPYLDRFVLRREFQAPKDINTDIGELMNPFESALHLSRKNAEVMA